MTELTVTRGPLLHHWEFVGSRAEEKESALGGRRSGIRAAGLVAWRSRRELLVRELPLWRAGFQCGPAVTGVGPIVSAETLYASSAFCQSLCARSMDE